MYWERELLQIILKNFELLFRVQLHAVIQERDQ